MKGLVGVVVQVLVVGLEPAWELVVVLVEVPVQVVGGYKA